jgi:mRNA interferase HigB
MAKVYKNRVISREKIREFVAAHPGHAAALPILMSWYRIESWAQWANFADVRERYPSADQVGSLIVFNIGGNKIRLIARVFYNTKPRRIFIKHVLTHRECDKGDWKE